MKNVNAVVFLHQFLKNVNDQERNTPTRKKDENFKFARLYQLQVMVVGLKRKIKYTLNLFIIREQTIVTLSGANIHSYGINLLKTKQHWN